jgi:hypothetical protein
MWKLQLYVRVHNWWHQNGFSSDEGLEGPGWRGGRWRDPDSYSVSSDSDSDRDC